MAFSYVPLVATGDTWTASQHNTYIRDNFSEIWKGSTLGDMDYYTSITTKGKINRPITNSGLLSMTAGGTPSWVELTGFQVARNTESGMRGEHAAPIFAIASSASESSALAAGVDNQIAFGTTVMNTAGSYVSYGASRIDVAVTGYYRFTWQLVVSYAGGTPAGTPVELQARLKLTNAITSRSEVVLPYGITGTYFYINGSSSPFLVLAGEYVSLNFWHNDTATWKYFGGQYNTSLYCERVA